MSDIPALWKELNVQKQMIDELRASKMNKPDEWIRGSYPDISTIVAMQENAQRLLKMAVGQATHAKSPRSDLVKDELANMLPPEEKHVDDSNLRRVVESLAKRISINTVSNRCLSSFVLANFSGRLPKAFMDSYSLKRIELTPPSSTGMSFEYPHLSDVLYQPHELFAGRELHAVEWNQSTNGAIKMPRLSFLGDETKSVIQTSTTVQGSKVTIDTFTNRVQVPETGIRGVRVRAT